MDGYLRWLMDQVDCPDEYSRLMEKLDQRVFTWKINNDANRAADGMSLRGRYIDETGVGATEEIFMHPCSVLEMLVALACRIEDDIMFDPAYGDRAPQWFWEMITNLKLDGMTNDNFDEENVNQILNVFLGRTYFMNGSGGLFPLKRPRVNQRRVEVWYQMSEYLMENY